LALLGGVDRIRPSHVPGKVPEDDHEAVRVLEHALKRPCSRLPADTARGGITVELVESEGMPPITKIS
jgi:hypothetical protein